MTYFFLKIFFLIFLLQRGTATIDLSFMTKFFSKYADEGNEAGLVGSTTKSVGKNICDENKLMLHLAKLFVISPERIILLLTGDSVSEICSDIVRVKSIIKTDFKDCTPLSTDNLYMKLLEGVRMLYENICQSDSRSKVIEKHQLCLKELREEYIDCEGPADWFERTNKTVLCQIFVDILNCDYIKTAELCGMEAAFTTRSISVDVFKSLIPGECKVPRSLPKIKQPMPATVISQRPMSCISYLFVIILSSFLI